MLARNIIKGDVLVFIASDNNYKTLLSTSVYKKRSPHFFEFAALTYDSPSRPTIEEIKNENFFGSGNRSDDFSLCSEKEKDKMWQLYPKIKPYCLGSYGFLIARKLLRNHKDQFEFNDNINIVNDLNKIGGRGINANSIKVINDFFTTDYYEFMMFHRQSTYAIKAIVRD